MGNKNVSAMVTALAEKPMALNRRTPGAHRPWYRKKSDHRLVEGGAPAAAWAAVSAGKALPVGFDIK
jgi:hypothetical protein